MSRAVEVVEEEVEHDQFPPLIGHRMMDPAKRVALCGTPILGIKASGNYVVCGECRREWDRLREAEARGDWILLRGEERPS